VNALRALGMPPYGCQPPTGYPDRADAWMNAGALVGRMNFATTLASNRLPGVSVDIQSLAGPADADAQRARPVSTLVGGRGTGSAPAAGDRAWTAPEFVALTVGSPEFQRK
jgi:uncharacterized protein (DUF1800 family)